MQFNLFGTNHKINRIKTLTSIANPKPFSTRVQKKKSIDHRDFEQRESILYPRITAIARSVQMYRARLSYYYYSIEISSRSFRILVLQVFSDGTNEFLTHVNRPERFRQTHGHLCKFPTRKLLFFARILCLTMLSVRDLI